MIDPVRQSSATLSVTKASLQQAAPAVEFQPPQISAAKLPIYLPSQQFRRQMEEIGLLDEYGIVTNDCPELEWRNFSPKQKQKILEVYERIFRVIREYDFGIKISISDTLLIVLSLYKSVAQKGIGVLYFFDIGYLSEVLENHLQCFNKIKPHSLSINECFPEKLKKQVSDIIQRWPHDFDFFGLLENEEALEDFSQKLCQGLREKATDWTAAPEALKTLEKEQLYYEDAYNGSSQASIQTIFVSKLSLKKKCKRPIPVKMPAEQANQANNNLGFVNKQYSVHTLTDCKSQDPESIELDLLAGVAEPMTLSPLRTLQLPLKEFMLDHDAAICPKGDFKNGFQALCCLIGRYHLPSITHRSDKTYIAYLNKANIIKYINERGMGFCSPILEAEENYFTALPLKDRLEYFIIECSEYSQDAYRNSIYSQITFALNAASLFVIQREKATAPTSVCEALLPRVKKNNPPNLLTELALLLKPSEANQVPFAFEEIRSLLDLFAFFHANGIPDFSQEKQVAGCLLEDRVLTGLLKIPTPEGPQCLMFCSSLTRSLDVISKLIKVRGNDFETLLKKTYALLLPKMLMLAASPLKNKHEVIGLDLLKLETTALELLQHNNRFAKHLGVMLIFSLASMGKTSFGKDFLTALCQVFWHFKTKSERERLLGYLSQFDPKHPFIEVFKTNLENYKGNESDYLFACAAESEICYSAGRETALSLWQQATENRNKDRTFTRKLRDSCLTHFEIHSAFSLMASLTLNQEETFEWLNAICSTAKTLNKTKPETQIQLIPKLKRILTKDLFEKAQGRLEILPWLLEVLTAANESNLVRTILLASAGKSILSPPIFFPKILEYIKDGHIDDALILLAKTPPAFVNPNAALDFILELTSLIKSSARAAEFIPHIKNILKKISENNKFIRTEQARNDACIWLLKNLGWSYQEQFQLLKTLKVHNFLSEIPDLKQIWVKIGHEYLDNHDLQGAYQCFKEGINQRIWQVEGSNQECTRLIDRLSTGFSDQQLKSEEILKIQEALPKGISSASLNNRLIGDAFNQIRPLLESKKYEEAIKIISRNETLLQSYKEILLWAIFEEAAKGLQTKLAIDLYLQRSEGHAAAFSQIANCIEFSDLPLAEQWSQLLRIKTQTAIPHEIACPWLVRNMAARIQNAPQTIQHSEFAAHFDKTTAWQLSMQLLEQKYEVQPEDSLLQEMLATCPKQEKSTFCEAVKGLHARIMAKPTKYQTSLIAFLHFLQKPEVLQLYAENPALLIDWQISLLERHSEQTRVPDSSLIQEVSVLAAKASGSENYTKEHMQRLVALTSSIITASALHKVNNARQLIPVKFWAALYSKHLYQEFIRLSSTSIIAKIPLPNEESFYEQLLAAIQMQIRALPLPQFKTLIAISETITIKTRFTQYFELAKELHALNNHASLCFILSKIFCEEYRDSCLEHKDELSRCLLALPNAAESQIAAQLLLALPEPVRRWPEASQAALQLAEKLCGSSPFAAAKLLACYRNTSPEHVEHTTITLRNIFAKDIFTNDELETAYHLLDQQEAPPANWQYWEKWLEKVRWTDSSGLKILAKNKAEHLFKELPFDRVYAALFAESYYLFKKEKSPFILTILNTQEYFVKLKTYFAAFDKVDTLLNSLSEYLVDIQAYGLASWVLQELGELKKPIPQEITSEQILSDIHDILHLFIHSNQQEPWLFAIRILINSFLKMPRITVTEVSRKNPKTGRPLIALLTSEANLQKIARAALSKSEPDKDLDEFAKLQPLLAVKLSEALDRVPAALNWSDENVLKQVLSIIPETGRGLKTPSVCNLFKLLYAHHPANPQLFELFIKIFNAFELFQRDPSSMLILKENERLFIGYLLQVPAAILMPHLDLITGWLKTLRTNLRANDWRKVTLLVESLQAMAKANALYDATLINGVETQTIHGLWGDYIQTLGVTVTEPARSNHHKAIARLIRSMVKHELYDNLAQKIIALIKACQNNANEGSSQQHIEALTAMMDALIEEALVNDRLTLFTQNIVGKPAVLGIIQEALLAIVQKLSAKNNLDAVVVKALDALCCASRQAYAPFFGELFKAIKRHHFFDSSSKKHTITMLLSSHQDAEAAMLSYSPQKIYTELLAIIERLGESSVGIYLAAQMIDSFQPKLRLEQIIPLYIRVLAKIKTKNLVDHENYCLLAGNVGELLQGTGHAFNASEQAHDFANFWKDLLETVSAQREYVDKHITSNENLQGKNILHLVPEYPQHLFYLLEMFKPYCIPQYSFYLTILETYQQVLELQISMYTSPLLYLAQIQKYIKEFIALLDLEEQQLQKLSEEEQVRRTAIRLNFINSLPHLHSHPQWASKINEFKLTLGNFTCLQK